MQGKYWLENFTNKNQWICCEKKKSVVTDKYIQRLIAHSNCLLWFVYCHRTKANSAEVKVCSHRSSSVNCLLEHNSL